MKKVFHPIIAVLGACFLLVSTGSAQFPPADEILFGARMVTTLQDHDLRGSLQKVGSKTKVPIALFLVQNQGIEFQYFLQDNWNKFQLKLDDEKGSELFEGVGAKIRKFDDGKITQPISGTDLTYCLLYTSPSPRDLSTSRMPSSA